MTDADRVLYDLDEISLDEEGVAVLESWDGGADTQWYVRRRRDALAAAGLLSAVKWDPHLHPRGHDGKFINKFGWVKWLENGIWRQGQVQNIDDKGVWVRPMGTDHNELISNPSKRLYSLPTVKAKLDLPSPKSDKNEPGWQKTGGQAGSNPGGFYKVTADLPNPGKDDPHVGDSYYVKSAKSPSHAQQEVLANRLYERLGVPVPSVTMNDDATTVASKIVEGDRKSLSESLNDPEVMKRIREDFVIDAWLANWDVAGMGLDNIAVVDGVPYRLDAGGSLQWRAQGGAKGSKFGNEVGELGTLIDPKVNPQSAKVFGDISHGELMDGATRLAALRPQDIRDEVEEAGVPDDVADTLIARRKFIMDFFDIPEPGDPKWAPIMDPEPVEEEAPGVNLPEVKAKDLPSGPDSGSGANIADVKISPPTGDPTSINGVASDLPVLGEQITLSAEIQAHDNDVNAALGALNLVGKTFVIARGKTPPEPPETFRPGKGGGGGQSNGLFRITEVNPNNIRGIDAQGHMGQWYITPSLGQYDDIWMTEVDATIKPGPPVTLRKDGTIAHNGEVIGSWNQPYSWSSKKTLTIDAAHSIYGTDVQFDSTYGVAQAKSQAVHYSKTSLVPPAVKPKEPEAVAFEKKVKAGITSTPDVPEGASGGMLTNGVDAKVGQWVASIKDGSVGKIVKVPDPGGKLAAGGYVTVQDPDGTKKYRKVAQLKGIDPPANSSVEAVSKAAYSPAPPGGIYMKDGKTEPWVGLEVIAGTPGHTVAGKIVKIRSDGYLQIIDSADGKKKWRRAKTAELADPFHPQVKPAESPLGATEAAAHASITTAPTVGTPVGKVKYPAVDGSLVPQSQADTEAWVAAGRLLTKDGYVPHVGMTVRDTKGTQYIITKIKSQYQSAPDSIKLYDPVTGKELSRKVSTLSVDHAATLSGPDGKPIPRVKEFLGQQPDGAHTISAGPGSVVYRIKLKEYDYERNKMVEVDKYVVASTNTPEVKGDNALRTFDGGRISAEVALAQSSSFERVAILDYDSDQVFSADMPTKSKPQNGVVHAEATPFAVAIAEDELSKIKLKEGLGALEPAKTVKAESITELYKPPSVPATNEPEIPQITGAGAKLDELPSMLKDAGAKSIVDAVAETIRHSGKTAPDSGVHYGMGDSDYIEDMSVRTQLVDDTDTGERFVEVKLRLREDKLDAVADQLIVPAGAMKGGWAKTKVTPSDLIVGDKIAVRVGYTGSLKPNGDAVVPTATVAGTPKLIGKSDNGLDVYRVLVAFETGEAGEVDMEVRSVPSVPVFLFDPEMTVPPKNTHGVQQALSVTAQNAGWKVENGYGYQRAKATITGETGTGYGIFVDPTGVKKVSDGSYMNMQSGSGNGQFVLRRDLGDGAQVHLHVVGTATSGRNATSGPGGSDARRMTLNGLVTIRVPIEKDLDPDKADEVVSLEVSKALESVGIPPEAQGPPSPEQLAKLAINKVHKQFAPQYHHMEEANASGLPGDAGTEAVLAEIDARIGPHLGRKATLDDVMFRTSPNGRTTVVLSDDVAIASSESMPTQHYTHGVGAGKLTVLEMLSSPVGGLLSSDERFSSGVQTSGASPQADNHNDAANRVYFYPRFQSHLSGGSGTRIVFSPNAFNKLTDTYATSSDTFGYRQSNNQIRFQGNASQYLVKGRVDRDQIGVVETSDAAWLIAELKKRGIDQIGGRPLEEVIISGSYEIPKGWDAGMHPPGTVEIPLSSILGGVTPDVSAAPEVVLPEAASGAPHEE